MFEFRNQVLEGLCLDWLKRFPEAIIDAVISDIPYGIGSKDPTPVEILEYLSGDSELDTGGDFMGEDWSIPSIHVWEELYRVVNYPSLKGGA